MATGADSADDLAGVQRARQKPLWIIAAVVGAVALVLALLGPSIVRLGEGGTAASHNDTDVHFLGMMVPHHEQAIEMSDVLLASDVDDPQVRDLAQRIKDGQQRENDQMRAWADEWGIHEDMEMHSHHIANGMFYPEQLAEFRKLEGEELRTTFLEWMHYHHAHVILMTQGEMDNGAFAPLQDMAREMIDVQTAEMREMEQILGYTPK
ncbi:DUF305 domain-containing protein [Corynebacterium sp. TA-R-1]|uniref:DUF305 domain-containing protein n=1 Tax=Corynebacterium stercoris TaxID=2943490 RepID=A0ABT1FYW3_9CORY|nr:DUF305 domain-containing protein [Corynebacterium stercoris]MCP1386952.1 DUF305 domain-containing protein [Corynebacterium stercoris]